MALFAFLLIKYLNLRYDSYYLLVLLVSKLDRSFHLLENNMTLQYVKRFQAGLLKWNDRFLPLLYHLYKAVLFYLPQFDLLLTVKHDSWNFVERNDARFYQ